MKSSSKLNQAFLVRLNKSQKKELDQASNMFSKKLAHMVREALFDFYLPAQYKVLEKLQSK